MTIFCRQLHVTSEHLFLKSQRKRSISPLVWYCQFDVSPVNYSDPLQLYEKFMQVLIIPHKSMVIKLSVRHELLLLRSLFR